MQGTRKRSKDVLGIEGSREKEESVESDNVG